MLIFRYVSGQIWGVCQFLSDELNPSSLSKDFSRHHFLAILTFLSFLGIRANIFSVIYSVIYVKIPLKMNKIDHISVCEFDFASTSFA